MIPYDDLVAALTQWRARQGLPVSMGSAGSGGTPAPGSGPHGAPGSGPNASSSRPGMAAATHEVDDAEVLEADAYENEGYAAGNEVEPTAIGSAPERPTENDMGGGGGGRDDW